MTTSGQVSILVVDDEEVNLQILVNILNSQSYNVVSATSGEQGWTALKENPVDIVLLDIEMPGMDGIEVLKKIRATPETENIPVIMLTARDTSEDIVKALDLGASDYITKPIDIAVLLARIQAHTNGNGNAS